MRRARLKTNGLRERAWWVMRRHGTFMLPEILAVAAGPNDLDARTNIGKYLKALKSAGILAADATRVMLPGSPSGSNGYLRYRLVIDLGHKAPVYRITRQEVYDPNGKKCYPLLEENKHA